MIDCGAKSRASSLRKQAPQNLDELLIKSMISTVYMVKLTELPIVVCDHDGAASNAALHNVTKAQPRSAQLI
jgi:hypothetical protein